MCFLNQISIYGQFLPWYNVSINQCNMFSMLSILTLIFFTLKINLNGSSITMGAFGRPEKEQELKKIEEYIRTIFRTFWIRKNTLFLKRLTWFDMKGFHGIRLKVRNTVSRSAFIIFLSLWPLLSTVWCNGAVPNGSPVTVTATITQ